MVIIRKKVGIGMHECIYCRVQKVDDDFNREHVVPRMMGTYTNGFVLNSYQVCKDCNSYFSRELENKIGLNSYESFLRMRYGRDMSDGRALRKDRATFKGASGIFKGLEFTPIVDNSNPERIRMDIKPCVGIASEDREGEYDYYSLDELPEATPTMLEFLRKCPRGILTVGIQKVEALPVLQAKGYIRGDYQYNEPSVLDLCTESDILTDVNISIDSIVRRICAKTVFNYLCYKKGPNFVLDQFFDDLRNYIRYGTWSNNLNFRYSRGPVSTANVPNDTAHVVGYMYGLGSKNWTIMGCITWFGETTYIFTIGQTPYDKHLPPMCLPTTTMAYFDNIDLTIKEDEAVHIFGGSLG